MLRKMKERKIIKIIEILNNDNEIINPEKLISQFKININKKEKVNYTAF